MAYLDTVNEEVKAYFNILCEDFPKWLLPYLETHEMQRIGRISMNCGTDYSAMFHVRYMYSNLDHSVGVALIIWNFTHDKKQTLAGLFHDIATPVFKHCIDFMNGDSEKQESTEERTKEILYQAEDIMALLKKEGIKPEEVEDYKKYPIADNETPRLSADRFEYNFSSGLSFFRVWEPEEIARVYRHVIVVKNEDGVDELAFDDTAAAEEYIHHVSRLWPVWVSDPDRTVMQFLADICRSMHAAGYLTMDDLYSMSEQEVIDAVVNCGDPYITDAFQKFQKCRNVYRDVVYHPEYYCVNVTGKTRFVNPLVKTEHGVFRISDLSAKAAGEIQSYIDVAKGGYYTYFDFPFEPSRYDK